jgi:hypothetical protein
MLKPLDKQMQVLRQMGSGSMINGLFRGSAALSALCLAAGIHTSWPPCYMVAAFLAVIAVASYQTGPHIRRAVRALDSSLRSDVVVTINIESWSDSDAFYAIVPIASSCTWRMEFIPQGWQPRPGPMKAVAHFLPDVAWPALLVANEGIIYPRYAPKRVAT